MSRGLDISVGLTISSTADDFGGVRRRRPGSRYAKAARLAVVEVGGRTSPRRWFLVWVVGQSQDLSH